MDQSKKQKFKDFVKPFATNKIELVADIFAESSHRFLEWFMSPERVAMRRERRLERSSNRLARRQERSLNRRARRQKRQKG